MNTNIIVGIYFLRDLKKGLVPLQKKGGLKFDDDFIKNQVIGNFDYIQLHGSETNERVKEIKLSLIHI